MQDLENLFSFQMSFKFRKSIHWLVSGLWILGLIHIFILLLTFLKKRNKNALKGNNANGLNV